MIYFIQIAENGPIKIGYTCERTAQRRLYGIQVGIPWRVIMRGVIQGEVVEELQLHAHLAEHRMRGEWFAPHPLVIETIQQIVGPWNVLAEATTDLPPIQLSDTPYLLDSDLNDFVQYLSKKYRIRPADIVTEAVRDALFAFTAIVSRETEAENDNQTDAKSDWTGRLS